jgi:uncharacterized protein
MAWRNVQLKEQIDAYFDIETTGLSISDSYITVAGIYLCNGRHSELIQLVGDEVTGDNLMRSLQGVGSIYTYNGGRFDFPFVLAHLGVNLEEEFCHHDLMYDCWAVNLYGGLKSVERQLGIPRQLQDVGGLGAIRLWDRYHCFGEKEALSLLLQYNGEDVINLRYLREKLAEKLVITL